MVFEDGSRCHGCIGVGRRRGEWLLDGRHRTLASCCAEEKRIDITEAIISER